MPWQPTNPEKASYFTKLPQALLSSGQSTPYKEQSHAFFLVLV